MSSPTPPIDRECVEGYLFARGPTRLLLFRRPPSRASIWVPVSGKVEPTDPDLVAALRRELREETGYRAPGAVTPLDWEVTFPAPNGETWRLHAFAVEVDPEFTPQLSDEHDAYAWVTPEDAIARLHYDDNREAVRRLLARLTGTGSRSAGSGGGSL